MSYCQVGQMINEDDEHPQILSCELLTHGDDIPHCHQIGGRRETAVWIWWWTSPPRNWPPKITPAHAPTISLTVVHEPPIRYRSTPMTDGSLSDTPERQ